MRLAIVTKSLLGLICYICLGAEADEQPILSLPLTGSHSCTQGEHGATSHNGSSTMYDLDLDTPNNTAEDPDDPLDVLAAAPGRAYGFDGCEFGTTGCNSGWGNYAKIFHGAGKYTIYAHLESVAQEIIDLMPYGLLVPRGYVIGQEGSTGNSVNKDGSRADHIHFGLHGGDPLGDSSGTSIP